MADHVITPGGPRTADLVNEVGPLGLVHVGKHTHTLHELHNNAFVAEIEPKLHLPTEAAIPSGWIVYGQGAPHTGQGVAQFSATWTVPPPPTTPRHQVIFLFNGMQNTGGDFGILQPVLQWGNNGRFGGSFWMLASWYAITGTVVHVSKAVQVQPGATVTGVIALSGHDNGELHYRSVFLDHPETVLNISTPTELRPSFVALEAYALSDCSDYPDVVSTVFSNIFVRSQQSPLAMEWNAVTRINNCGQEARVNSQNQDQAEITLRYRPPVVG